VITVCDQAKERCPFFSSAAKKILIQFSDLAKATGTDDEIMEQFRKVRDEIKSYSQKFVTEHIL
jgi:arsenate reductase